MEDPFCTSLISTAKEHAIRCHLGTCHEYDGMPYTIHLKHVTDFATKFKQLVPEKSWETVLAACWLHDTIEDCRQTYNDIVKICGSEVAEIVYALTNEKGRTRKERANSKYYEGIRDTPFAPFVKLCDRLANVEYSSRSKSSMFNKYWMEQPQFEKELYCEELEPMFKELRYLLLETNIK
jgi:(p)ppGpp synthase/HD superfamily hydrolase